MATEPAAEAVEGGQLGQRGAEALKQAWVDTGFSRAPALAPSPAPRDFWACIISLRRAAGAEARPQGGRCEDAYLPWRALYAAIVGVGVVE